MILKTAKKMALVLGMGACLAGGSRAYAQSSDAVLDLLVKKGLITQREANDAREQADKDAATTVELYNKQKVPSWIDKIDWSGDFRLRAEYFGFEDSLNKSARLRYRYRLRYGAVWTPNEWATIGLRLASGAPGGTNGGGDPVSTNTTLTDSFTKKPVYIDLAYVTITPPWFNQMKLTAGKMEIPIWQPKFNSPTRYDFDTTPEGIAEQFSFSFGDKDRYRAFLNAGQFAAKEISGDANDVYVFDQQVGFEARLGGVDPKTPRVKLTLAGGAFLTNNLDILAPGDSPNLGNSLAASGKFLDNFNVIYADTEVAWMIVDQPWLHTPALLTLSAEYAKNLKSTYHDTDSWTGQLAFGEAKKRGQWQVAYQYKFLKQNAVWDALTDSDWGGGGTDRSGHIVKTVYNIRDWWTIGATAFVTEKISSSTNSGHNVVGVTDEDLLRIQLDTVFKF